MVDTANFLQRSYGLPSPVAVAATAQEALPARATNFCSPYILKLRACPVASHHHDNLADEFWRQGSKARPDYDAAPPIDEEVIVEGRWAVERQRSSHRDAAAAAATAVLVSPPPSRRAPSATPGGTTNSGGKGGGANVHFALIRSIREGPRIVWKSY